LLEYYFYLGRLEVIRMIRWMINTFKPTVGIVGLVIIIAILVLVLAWISGCITYFLLSVVFPEYLEFNWYHLRFVALGFLHGIITGLITYKKDK